MSSGSAPCSAWIMTWDNVKEIIPKEMETLEKLLFDNEYDSDDFCRVYTYGLLDSGEEFDTKLQKQWLLIEEVFEEKTKLGIEPSYHDSDDGDIYDADETDGGFFIIHGVTQLTKAGEKYEDSLVYARWVSYG